ncbi:MAG TPA: hypothetical protein VFF29_00175, partial [Bacteroidota bacterium]|nr:hypothetical protein [Bacteroidota bacterium]
GYWMKFPNQSSYVAVGDERSIDTVDVDSKWNMVGTLSFPIAATNVGSIPQGNIATAFFGYDNETGYFTADTLLPLRAYWVKMNASGQLIMNVSGFQKLRKKDATSINVDKLNSLYFRNASGAQQQLHFGRLQNQSLDLSWYELPPSPPFSSLDVRYASDD